MPRLQACIGKLWILLLFYVFPSAPAWAVIYVKANATGANTGASWSDAYTDLQTTLQAAEYGDEIWVAVGTYKPTVGTDRTKSFVLTAGTSLYGGFAGTESLRDKRNWVVNETILSGEIGAQGASDNSAHVVSGGFNTRIDGFTIRDGNVARVGGAGMINDSVSPTIANCIFIRNGTTDGNGGGMTNINASPTVINCTFTLNSADGFRGGNGAGMYNSGGSPIITNCTFIKNSATYGGSDSGGGGGFCSASGSPVLTNAHSLIMILALVVVVQVERSTSHRVHQ